MIVLKVYEIIDNQLRLCNETDMVPFQSSFCMGGFFDCDCAKDMGLSLEIKTIYNRLYIVDGIISYGDMGL